MLINLALLRPTWVSRGCLSCGESGSNTEYRYELLASQNRTSRILNR